MVNVSWYSYRLICFVMNSYRTIYSIRFNSIVLKEMPMKSTNWIFSDNLLKHGRFLICCVLFEQWNKFIIFLVVNVYLFDRKLGDEQIFASILTHCSLNFQSSSCRKWKTSNQTNEWYSLCPWTNRQTLVSSINVSILKYQFVKTTSKLWADFVKCIHINWKWEVFRSISFLFGQSEY